MAGVFGKMPVMGDFVSRGLPRGTGPTLDHWLTRYLAAEAADPELWPECGIRALIDARGGPLVALVLPSADRRGRPFPLAAIARAPAVGRVDADAWADSVLGPLAEAASGRIEPDAVERHLATLRPRPGGTPRLVPPLVWAEHTKAVAPANGLRELFRRVSSD
jgi:type VI secretion system protein ImpM